MRRRFSGTFFFTGVVLVAMIAVAGGPVEAGITASTGISVLASPPSSVVESNLESNTLIFAFLEKLDFKTTSSVAADVTQAGLYNKPSTLTGKGGTVAAGTPVLSWYIHRDPPALGSPSVTLSGSITFSEKIVGILLLDASLAATHGQFGVSGTTYTTNVKPGLELGSTTGYDTLTLSSDLRTVSFTLGAGQYVDQIRILTTPEPGTIALFGLGLLGLGISARRRRLRSKKACD